jgi:F420-dependent oxidoreductase-like protein
MGMQPMFIYHMPNYSFPDPAPERLFDQLVENAQAAENAGFDLVTVMDHFYQIRGVGPEAEPMLEAYTTLGALAARTTSVKLGSMVSGVTYRNPAALAKQVTTLDVISKGRAVMGLGAAWSEDEHHGYGFAFPVVRERLDRLEEALEICSLMFTEERPSYEGRYYRIDRALNSPRPIQPGGPKILIGGSGERRTLRLLARFGDIGNWFGTLEELLHKKSVFEQHCAEVGRDPSEVILTIMAPVLVVRSDAEGRQVFDALSPERRVGVTVGSPEQCADALRPYLDAGFGGFVLRNPGYMTPERVMLAGDLIRLLKG